MSTPLRSRWLDWPAQENRANTGTNRTVKTIKRSEQGAFDGFDGAECAPERPATFDPDGGTIAAVKLRNTVIGDLWLVAETDTLAEHPDILRAGLPVFFFEEIEGLRGKTPAELKEIAMVKAVFPAGRVLQ